MVQPSCSPGHAPGIPPSAVYALNAAGSADSTANHGDATQKSFDHNRQTIPGLGLGFFGKAESSVAKQTGASAKETSSRANATGNDSAEEGEITADEFEDLYESQEPVYIPQEQQHASEIDASYVEMSDEERDRSGSYSPFLSAREMDMSPPTLVPMPTGYSAAISVPSTAEVQLKSIDLIAEARIQAKDAILRLQAANIGYQDYVNEGIDKTVLDQLFGDLGLETSHNPASAVSTVLPAPPDKVSTAVSTVKDTVAPATASLDKSESRKDRIARLLAAKGSKATKAGGATVIGKVAKAASTKINSEKSKLLQQKMEALLKAREEKQKALERQTTVTASELISNQESLPNTTHAAIAAEPPSALSSAAAASATASGQTTKPSASEAVISVSSSAKAAALSTSRSGSASEGPFQKPFGQTRPFLIDVSDDDDDIDMDMESPEQRMSVLHAPTSPGKRQLQTPLLVQSPGSMSTPPAARHDLESMNKRIEAMKRKIAEAEAKKRLKLSAPASPVASPRPRAYDIYEAKSSSPDGNASPINDTVSSRLPKVAETRLASPGSPKINRSRAASERLPMLESRRKEQILRLKALQSQVANIERELKEGLAEEQKLREDLDYISDDEYPPHNVLEETAPRSASARTHTESIANAEQSGGGHADPVSMLSSDHIATESSSRSSPEVMVEDVHTAAPSDGQSTDPKADSSHDVAMEVTMPSMNDVDIAMEEAGSSGDEADDDSDGYEPAEASPYETGESSPNFKTSEAAPEITDSDPAVAALSAELLYAGRQDSAPAMEQEREVGEGVSKDADEAFSRPSYLAYDSPLRYFHSYRFHPNFHNVVAGGLRSATYSNKIDSKLPLCPDELAGNVCPRGKNCHFQHFAEMSAPDDQILLQLGAYTNCEESRKQEYIEGLRQLLTDYRNRKVKDFQTISQGIIEYRARFHGDASKVLPLGTVLL
ncbi:Zinc finger domain-containing protein, CCCH-type [Cordyceps javanica]|uniref:Zinc finger domain-containing protein, CCCH-type n=1 Tax=Cordyceps javanica TaxID=43265 RepID=A0A545UV31_9HYPO|nr:Zinc finger domain-containing protein, CCCH-type [Cordyceps javanica]TQW05331.1 Zinc finger domain-containing protein, CCCH-type [Cordyceps javanica]